MRKFFIQSLGRCLSCMCEMKTLIHLSNERDYRTHRGPGRSNVSILLTLNYKCDKVPEPRPCLCVDPQHCQSRNQILQLVT